MTDLNALLRAIITTPDDDTARLAYADCLDELPTRTVTCTHCEPEDDDVEPHPSDIACPKCGGTKVVADTANRDRAEFIRVQVELSRLPKCEFANEDTPRCDQTTRPYSISCKACNGRRREWDIRNSFSVAGFLCKFDRDETVYEKATAYVGRGFVSRLRCTAADFLTHADALIWHPDQKMQCESCSGEMRDVVWEDRCDTCDGAGRIPRPCPDTANSITDITLTACGDWDSFLTDNDFSLLRSVWTSPKWPGVKFHLPPTSSQPIPTDGWIVQLPGGRYSGVWLQEHIQAALQEITIVREGNGRLPLAVRLPETILTDLTAHDVAGVRYTIPRAIITHAEESYNTLQLATYRIVALVVGEVSRAYPDPFPDVPWGGGL